MSVSFFMGKSSLILLVWSANLDFTLSWRPFPVYFSPRFKLFFPTGIASGCLCQRQDRKTEDPAKPGPLLFHQRYLQPLRPRIREARTGPPGPLEVPTHPASRVPVLPVYRAECKKDNVFRDVQHVRLMPDSAVTAMQNDIIRELVGQFPQKQIHADRITIGHDQEAGSTGQRLYAP